MAEIVRLEAENADEAFSRARQIIRNGGIVAYPTETFYGLGADPRLPEAVRKLFEIKGRKGDQPILLLLPDEAEVGNWAAEISDRAKTLMDRYWPGPLTLVFAARGDVPDALTGGTGTIGLRVPGNTVTRALLRAVGSALTGTSANISGGANPDRAEMVERELGGMIDLILDGGRTPGGMPSTVLDVTGNTPRIIREGAITNEELRRVAGMA